MKERKKLVQIRDSYFVLLPKWMCKVLGWAKGKEVKVELDVEKRCILISEI